MGKCLILDCNRITCFSSRSVAEIPDKLIIELSLAANAFLTDYSNPYAPCMVYLPTFGCLLGQM